MGLAASQSRFLSLTARQSNIELNGQQVNQQRMVLSSMENQYAVEMTSIMSSTNFNGFTVDPTTGTLIANAGGTQAVADQYNALQTTITNLQGQDKNLEMQLKDIDTQHIEVQTEIDAVKKVIDKNIDQTFKTFA